MKRGRLKPEEMQNSAERAGGGAVGKAGKYVGSESLEEFEGTGRPRRPKGFGRPGRAGHRTPDMPGIGAAMRGQADIPEEIAEDIKTIIPDFVRIRKTFLALDCTFVLICFVLEICYLLASHYNGAVSMTDAQFIVRQIAVPTGVNVLVLLFMFVAKKKLPQNNEEMRQNLLPLIGMILICMVTSITHCNMTITLTIFVVPLVMTTVYTNDRLCKLVAMISFDGQMIAVIKHLIVTPDPSLRSIIGIESLVIILVHAICTQVALALLDMSVSQRNKMYNFMGDIKEAQINADAANRAKSAFLANMSHEIRTPINAILGMDEMILRESKDDQITEYAETIYSASTSLLYLVNDVLDISKIESGKLEIVENTYDTASLIHDCCTMISERVTKKGLDFNVFCNPNLPSQLKGDEIHLRQIITNILSNAAKYTEKGSVTMSADQQLVDGKFWLTVSVKDTGIGITEENLANLFTQFTRFDLEKTRNIEGTGLGLSITKQLVDLMGGQISAESTYGRGTTFKVTIPQEIVDDSPMGNFEQRYQDASKKSTAIYHKRFEAPEAMILVVDDMEGNLKVVSNLLKQTKVHVDTANSGKLCLEKVAQNVYDIIFMDHMMPEMNGIETYKKMKEMDECLNKETPVIMLTANAITGVKDEYMEAGFTDYMSKPVLGDKLERMVAKYLPEEKIVYREEKEEPKEKDTSANHAEADKEPKINLVRLQEFYQSYPKIDIVHGLEHFGQNTNIYISSLHMLCGHLDTESMVAYCDARDTEKYEMLMHDIKRFSMDNGFFKLSEQAGLLEKAAQEENWEAIVAGNGSFVTECKDVITSIQKYLDRRT